MKIDAQKYLRCDGQLSDLSLEMLVAEELEPAEASALEALLSSADRKRLEAARQHQAQLHMKPRSARIFTFPRTLATAITTLAAAAALMLWIQPQNDEPGLRPEPAFEDGFRLKSRGLDFELFVHNGQVGRKVLDGAKVYPGDRVGFRVKARSQGFFLLAGIDEHSAPYPCWPPGEKPEAVAWSVEAPVKIDRAMELDTTPGTERFIAAYCEQPLSFSMLEAVLLEARLQRWTEPFELRSDCVLRMMRLEKQP